MKGVVISACIAVIIITGSIAYTNHIENVSNDIGGINDKIMYYLEEENYEEAKRETYNLSQYLGSKRTILAAIGNHEELDKIDMNISEMSGYIDGKKKADALSCCRVLDFLFDHLPNNYEMKLENIL